MEKEFERQCPNCLEMNKLISKCPKCFKMVCRACSVNALCFDCYIMLKKEKEISVYFEEKLAQEIMPVLLRN